MLIRQIMNIGKLTLKDKTTYQLLVDNQTKYNKKYFVNVVLDLTEEKHVKEIKLQEYDPTKKYEYGFGITTGSASLFSPSFNIKWDDLKEEELYKKNKDKLSKIVNFTKLQLMTRETEKIKNQKTMVFRFLKWLETAGKYKKVHKEIGKYLYYNFIKKDVSPRERPNRLIFSFITDKDKITSLFPGQLKGFRELYELISGLGDDQSLNKGVCHACNEVKPLTGPFSIGLFTLDQYSFSIGFEGKKSEQYQICNDCSIFCNQGYNYIEENLKFRAYTIKEGREYIDVYHYIIPISTDLEVLVETLKQIRRAKLKLNEGYKAETEDRIIYLSESIRRADKKQKKIIQERKKEIDQLQKSKEIYEKNININFDIGELLEQFSDIQLSFLDVFFRITDYKQNPSVKEIINVLIVEKDRVQFLAKVISQIKNEYGLNKLKLNNLRFLISDKKYINYLSRLLNGTNIDELQFIKKSSRSIKQAFKDEYFANKQAFFSKKLKDFKVLYSLFERSECLNVGGKRNVK